MLTYSFEKIETESLYGYLYQRMKADIISGALIQGEKLPSKRAFAKNLGVSVITVETAYMQLIAEGYVFSIPKKGYFVAALPAGSVSLRKDAGTGYRTVKAAHRPEQKTIRETGQKAEPDAGKLSETYLADFSSNQTEKKQFPFSIWAKLVRELLSEHQADLLVNPPAGGVLLLRKEIAAHLRAFRGMQVEEEQIIIGAGTEYLYGLLVQLFGREKCYGVEDPGYQKIAQIYESSGAAYRSIHLEPDGISISDLEAQKVQIVHISPSHHFPTGLVTPVSKRYALLSWAAEDTSRYIIEDDYDSEFRLVGQPIPTLQSIDTMERVIYMNTFTKTLASTIRVSYMVLPKHLVQEFYEKLSFYSCTVSNLEQYTLARFLSGGYFEKHINRMRTYYHKKRDILLKEIASSSLKKYASISEENAGLHFLMELKVQVSDVQFTEQMKKRGVRIKALSDYYMSNEKKPEHIFVMNYSSLTEEQIRLAVRKLSEEVQSLNEKRGIFSLT